MTTSHTTTHLCASWPYQQQWTVSHHNFSLASQACQAQACHLLCMLLPTVLALCGPAAQAGPAVQLPLTLTAASTTALLVTPSLSSRELRISYTWCGTAQHSMGGANVVNIAMRSWQADTVGMQGHCMQKHFMHAPLNHTLQATSTAPTNTHK